LKTGGRPSEVQNHQPVKRRTIVDRILWAVLTILLIVGAVAWWKTAPPTLLARKTHIATIASTDLVDQSTYETALRLAQIALTRLIVGRRKDPAEAGPSLGGTIPLGTIA